MSPLISENKENFPVLIVDKIGALGSHLATKLSESSTVVFVSQKRLQDLENVIHIPYARKIPKVPDNLYSHIFVIDDGEDITIEALPSFLKKAQMDRAIFSFCTILGRKGLPSDIFDYKKSKILFLGDVFPQTGFFPKSYINSFLVTARNRERIEVPENGMTISYPIFFDDAISSILEASFGTSSDKVFYILPKHGVTLLSLAHSIQKKNPDVKIDFVNEDPIQPPKIVKEGRFLYPDSYPLEERINNFNISSLKLVSSYVGKNYKEEHASLGNLRLALFSVLFFLFLPFITTFFFTFAGFLFLDTSRVSFENSKSQVYLAKSTFSLAQIFSRPLLYETSFIKLDPIFKLEDSIEKGKKESEDIFGFYEGIELIGVGKTNEGISRIKDFLVFTQTNPKFKTLDKELLTFITQTINVWPQILAVDSPKSYLILFQNDNSLRGWGGKIDAFGVLKLEKGKITDFKIFNAYDLDKNLKGHVEPPFAIRRYLGLPNFHLMDASFDADFKEVVNSASFFADLETGTKVDGVFRVANSVFKRILEKEDAKDLKKYFQGKNVAKFFLDKKFVEMLYKKDFVLSFNDKGIENVFATNTTSSQGENKSVINDSIGLLETDLNGSNALGKKINLKVGLAEDGQVSSTVTLELTNSQNIDARKYLRFLVPGGTTLKKVVVDGQQIDFINAITDPLLYEAKNFNPPSLLEIETNSEANGTIFGFLVNVPKNKTQVVEVTFIRQIEPLAQLSNFVYTLHFFKQPGVEFVPFEFSINFPSTFKIYSEPKVSKTADRDFDLNFNFTK